MTLIEAVPNVSEGRRQHVVEKLVAVLREAPGSRLLDWSSDISHNRTVFTLVGEPEGLIATLLALYETAIPIIDIKKHRGAHPRVGAVDVVPFVPLKNVSTTDCVALARAFARTIAGRFAIPVYLYEDAAAHPRRRALEEIRRGQLDGLTQRMLREEWRPDFGPPTPHPMSGVSIIGVRQILIAFNVNLDTDDVEIAYQIAQVIRASSGGLSHVKAIGVRRSEDDRVQVSINLTDYRVTPIHRVFNLIHREADKRGTNISNSEIVGLVPADALISAASNYLRLDGFRSDQVLDSRMGGW